MFGMGLGELIVVFLIILLLFGADKLPEMAKGFGRAVKEFKKAASDPGSDAEAESRQEQRSVEQKSDKTAAG